MINTTELRLNNWCYLAWEPFRFTVEAYSYRNELLDPIPLTEEILLKARFMSHKEGVFIIWKRLSLNLIGTTFHYSRDKRVKIQYVHQLQNLYFVLTGAELQINL